MEFVFIKSETINDVFVNYFEITKEHICNTKLYQEPIGYSLLFDSWIMSQNGFEYVETIKYCPYCGEKLVNE